MLGHAQRHHQRMKHFYFEFIKNYPAVSNDDEHAVLKLEQKIVNKAYHTPISSSFSQRGA